MFQKFQRVCPSPNLLELPIYLRVLGPQVMFLALTFTDRTQTRGVYIKPPIKKVPAITDHQCLYKTPKNPILFDRNSERIMPQGHSIIRQKPVVCNQTLLSILKNTFPLKPVHHLYFLLNCYVFDRFNCLIPLTFVFVLLTFERKYYCIYLQMANFSLVIIIKQSVFPQCSCDFSQLHSSR